MDAMNPQTAELREVLNHFSLPRDVFRYAASKFPERIALITPEGSLTYQELGERTYKLGERLKATGIGAGDCIFTWLADGREQVEIRLAAYELGAALVSFHKSHPVEMVIGASQLIFPNAFLYDPRLGRTAGEFFTSHLPFGRVLRTGKDDTYERMINQGKAELNEHFFDRAMPAGFGFTSGTTGIPKVIFHDHHTILNSLRLVMENVKLSAGNEPPRLVLGIPLIGAGSGVVLPTLLSGGTLIIPRGYSIAEILPLISRYRANSMFITPSLLIDLLDFPQRDRYDLTSMQNIIYGTELTPAAKLEEAIRRFGPIFQHGYGMAEVLPPVSILRPEDHVSDGKPASREVLHSVGKPVPQAEVKIVDTNDNPVAANVVGEVAIKSPTVFSGYWQQPELTTRVLRHGWYHTGDLGYLDTNGYLHILNRLADVIDRDERVIYPRKIEEVIHEHPTVKEACLVAVGEPGELVLCLSLRHRYRETTSWENLQVALRRYLSDRLPYWELPDRFVLFEELPRSFLGKLLRREVREFLTPPEMAEEKMKMVASQ